MKVSHFITVQEMARLALSRVPDMSVDAKHGVITQALPLVDGKRYYVTLAHHMYPDITVPRGFICDLASTPFSFRSKKFVIAALLHDWRYWEIRQTPMTPEHKKQRKQRADKEFLHNAIHLDKCSKFRAQYAYQAVRFGGSSSVKPREEVYVAP